MALVTHRRTAKITRRRASKVSVPRTDEADAIARLAVRGVDEAAARARLANQTAQADKVVAADRLIEGSASLEETRGQVAAAYEALMAVR